MNPAELNLNPLSQIDPIVIVIVALIVVVTYLVLRRVYVQPYLEVMEAREELFQTARRRSSEASDVTRESDLQAETMLAEATASSEDLRTAAQLRADGYRKARLSEASAAASELLEHGRAELQAVRVRELASVHAQAVECVTAACEQLLGSTDAEAVESTVERLMETKAR
jgi:F0F1-type ATP synthase membrane subunit b/b'